MNNKRTENDIKQQKIMTRIYLILLTVSFLILILLTSLESETTLINESNPSLITYNNLQKSYLSSLQCPCSKTIISYKKFLSLSPIFHDICSSYLIENEWVDIMRSLSFTWKSKDWRRKLYSYFQLLSNLCQLSRKTTDESIQRFLSQSFVLSNIINENDFNKQFDTILDQFCQSTIIYFNLIIDAIQLLIQVDQPYTESAEHSVENDFLTNLHINIMKPNNKTVFQVKFILNEINDFNSTFIKCICAINPYCENNPYNDIYLSSGLVSACSTMDSILYSTFECFYSKSNCLKFFLKYALQQIPIEYHSIWESKIHPFIYDSSSNRFSPNISIGIIIKNLMIENWNATLFYTHFYQSCAPNYCTYLEKRRVKTFIEVLITFVSMIGGLTASLHLITPYLLNIILNLLQWIKQKQQQSQRVHPKYSDRLKFLIRNLNTLFHSTIINLNIFRRRDFSSNLDQIRAKYLGQWATRLYIVLLVIGITIVILFTITQPRTITETFDKPSIDEYNHLLTIYGNKLECSCSFISSSYNKFVKIEPKFHEICLSTFISDQWRINMTLALVKNFSIYEQNDYRRFLSAHLQLLQGLCHLSIKLVNNSINQTLHSLFTTLQLLSNKNFQTRISSLIERSKSDAVKIFSDLFFLIRSINHGNNIMSTYGTNFQYIIPWTSFQGSYIPTQALFYDNQCSCSSQPNCSTQANFFIENSNKNISIKGLKIGCTPSESFLSSSLECFYDLSCIYLLHQYTNSTYSSIYLSAKMKRSSINTTINELTDNLFVDEWITKMNYISYFKQCSPSLCSYTYIQQFHLLYTINFLFAFQGGLTIILKWICPLLVAIIDKIHQYQTRRTNIIQPIQSSQEISSVETIQ
ncbi:unnamed protein product [Adineta ricciae]|uniref:Transmembrane protein n=1 Tax=Adineta ricciae TaxID=249248 RepID=A0A815ER09_ADIRI|nr:unnamed protein product [Adineta ricciae]